MRRFEDKAALVSGAASGIGRATALRLAREGASVLCVDVQAEALEMTAKDALLQGGRARALICDVTNREEVDAAVQACVDDFGKLDVLCNIAGIIQVGHFAELTVQDWNKLLAVNVTGIFQMCQSALPRLLETRGNIVNASSAAALKGLPYGVAYSATKGAISAMTRSLAIEYSKRHVRVNAVCPASIETPMMDPRLFAGDFEVDLLMRQSAINGPRSPDAVASTIAYLASDDAIHLTGEEIRVDGGALS